MCVLSRTSSYLICTTAGSLAHCFFFVIPPCIVEQGPHVNVSVYAVCISALVLSSRRVVARCTWSLPFLLAVGDEVLPVIHIFGLRRALMLAPFFCGSSHVFFVLG